MSKILLIDGNSLMFRAYYATAYTGNLMQSKSGVYTNAIFGFCNMMTKLVDDSVDKVFVAFDAGKQTFRHKQYDDYKAGRKPMPDEFRMQIPYIKKYLDLMNIKHYECLDYEADDLVGAYSKLCNKEGNEVYVVTGDKDLLQLAKGNISVCLTKKGITELDTYTESNFHDKMGFYSYQIPDYKGLVGDSSDNLPGIKGIGEKTALKLLNEYDTLENIISHVDELKGKVHNTILENKDTGLKCKYLATLCLDFDLPYTYDEIDKVEPNYKELMDFFREIDFNSMLKKTEKDLLKSTTPKDNKEVVEEKELEVEIATETYDFSKIGNSFIIVETYKENYITDPIIGFGILSEDEKIKVFVPYNIIGKNSSLKAYLESDYNKITFDYKRLYVILKLLGITIKNVNFDVLLAAYLINPSFVSDDVKQVLEHFSETTLNYDESVYGYKSKAHTPELEIVAKHSINKCLAIKEILPDLFKEIKDLNQEFILTTEFNLSPILGDMEINGVYIDREKLNEVGMELTKNKEELEKQIYILAGCEFNINSVKQLGEILFEKLGLPSGKKNKTGYSTSSEVLEKLAPNYEIAKLVLDYRGVTKIISTYVNGLEEVMNDKNFVHPLYKQALTATGRLSSVNPNIQNMPVRSEVGQVIREAFVSRFDGGKIMGCDYSQIELRVLAHMADDEPMIASFNSKADFHTNTASWLYEVDPSEVTKDMRRTAKAINFGIVYGMSAWGLSESVGISPFEANMYIMKYFTTHHKVRTFLDNVIENAKKDGYTKTMYNRVRYIPELQSSNKNLVNFGERTAMNAPIQGSAADIIKMAMVKVSKAMKDRNMKSVMIAQVHDELLFDCFPGELDDLQTLVKTTMESVVSLKVPLIAEAESGNNWLEA